MKKLTLLLFALFFWTGAWADGLVNHAYGLIPTVLSAANTPNAEHLAYLTDGDFGMPYAETTKSAAFGSTNPTIFYYDLGSEKAIGRISISWTGAHAKNYKIYAVNETPADAEAASKLTGEIVNATDVSVPSQTNRVVSYDVTTTARYIVFVATSFEYGCTMHEFAVYSEAYEQVFSSFVSKSGTYVYNVAQQVDLLLLDQEGASFEGSVTSISFANSTYGYDKNLSNPSFTFGADFPSAFDELSVTVGDVTRTRGFGFLNNTPAVGDVPAIDDGTSYVIFSAEKNEKHDVYDGYDGDNTSIVSSDFSINGHNAVLVRKMTYVGFKNNTFNPSKTDMTSLVLDIFVTEPHAKENCHVKAENQGTLDFPQDLNRGWNHVVLTNFNTSTFAGLTSNTTLFVRIDDAADEDVVIYNLYYSKESSFIDTENPEMSSVAVTSTHNTATLTVKATDDNTSGTLTYTVKNSSNETVGTGSAVQNENATITITGLTPETNYAKGAFTVFATDPSGKSSTSMDVPAFTTAAAPTGLELTAGGHTILLQGKHYLDRATNNWELTISSNDDMEGLGGSFWSLSSGNSDLRTNFNVSDDYKTMTILATSTTKPLLYTPLYVILKTNNQITFCEGDYFNNNVNWVDVGVETMNIVVSNNTASVTGPVTASDVTTIQTNAGSAAAIDLSGATISENITITPTNINAIVIVGGTSRTPNANGEKVTASNGNLVVYDNTYRRAATGHVITLVDDNASQPAYNFVIDAQADGFTYTRTVAAGKWVSYFSPASVTVPEGVSVYKATDATSSSVTFTKQENQYLGANVPVILHNNTNDAIVITSNIMNNDLNLTANPDGAAIKETGITQFGTARLIEADGTQFALQNNDLKRFNIGAKIGAFRVYFTGLSSANARAIFIDGETTKIGSINANGEINVEDGVYYNLAGQRVQNPKKGIYIINGKKVVIK